MMENKNDCGASAGAETERKFSSLVSKIEKDELTPQQQAFLDDFIARYIKQTGKSKEWMIRYSPAFCDWLTVIAYRQSLKEIRYPIVSDRSLGARIWDIDGNEYIDLALGYGVSLLGHNPPFVTEAIERQLRHGIQLGPQFEKTGELAKLISEMTGTERVFFSNTGTEAVMSSMRIARGATGRDKIVIFNDSFHGHFDGVKGVPDENGGVRPKVLGTPYGMTDDLIIVEYGSEESLDIIRSHSHELAAVLVEPFQTRKPWLHVSKEYIQELRKITEEAGAALIFDEIVTGFRIHPGGAQAYFDVRPDIIAYGKTIGGGMPMSVIAGKAKFMDMIDGGSWNFGDDSHPNVKMTSVAGTFCKHPLAVVAALATLKHLKKEGASLQEKVFGLVKQFADILNPYFEKERVPLKVNYFGGICELQYLGECGKTETGAPLVPIEVDILFPLLVLKGVFAWEMRVCCFSTQHTPEDIEKIAQAVKESVEELRAGGFPFSK